jgi:hypothetical protein
MTILTPTEARQNINVPVSGEPASAGWFTSNVVQPLLNRIYMVERILDGLYTRAVTLKGFFQAEGGVSLGNNNPTPNTVTSFGNFVAESGFRAKGKINESTLFVDDAHLYDTPLRRHYVYETLSTERNLRIDLGGSAPVSGDIFTVWNNANSNVSVSTVNGFSSEAWIVPSHTNRTFQANSYGQIKAMD